MRIVVLSDTHGRIRNFEKIYRKQPGADLFLHLGDGNAEVEMMRGEHPNSAFVTVRGNCDFGSDEPDEKLMVLEGKRIFFTHGHRYMVKAYLDRFLERAREENADIALFGHTHIAFCEYLDGIYVMNPGSAERPRNGLPQFGIIDLTANGVAAYLSEIN